MNGYGEIVMVVALVDMVMFSLDTYYVFVKGGIMRNRFLLRIILI